MDMYIRKSIKSILGRSPGCLFAAACLAGGVGGAHAATVVPDAGDAFVYEYMPTTSLKSFGFNSVIVLGKSEVGNQLNGLVKFDVSGITLADNQKATLNLYVEPTDIGGVPAVSPTAQAPVALDVAAATGSWDPNTVTWNNAPGAGSTVASTVIDHTGYWASVDITSIIKSWVTGTSTNYGLVLTQDAAAFNAGWVGLTFDSAGAASNQPYLQISTVPEPATLGLIGGAGVLMLRRRRG